MNTNTLNHLWNYIRDEIHKEKPNKTNLIEREMWFVLQILLSQYELAKSEKNKKLMKFYADVLETYEKHNINGHIE